MAAGHSELGSLLGALLDGGIDFILVGGGAAVIHGAPITTQDVDIVHRRDDGNVDKLLAILGSLDGRIADPGGRDLKPSRQALLGTGQQHVRTRLGRLDVLGSLHDGRGYDDLITTAETIDFDGRDLRVIDLPTLIEVKASTGRARDRLVVPILLELARRREDS